ncbi:aldo/keto reductase [Motilimonas eburnea]|uniref:aldo/keto reductase n=1 Tax=Motilimonas eburnea TaxID=1737488 RepID=UPI001E3130D9|nr:aldo/keto reductase [Motilimonas eburnea]MCE2571136.1 aldo/keto reductase [Motilimonas eburnea]
MSQSEFSFASPLVQGYWRMAHWEMTAQQRLSFIKQHVELGMSCVDHAPVYQSEALFGEALALEPSLRQQLQVISKCGIIPGQGDKVAHYNSSKAEIIGSVDNSLRNLGVEKLDLLLIHRPDILMQADEVAEAFNQLQGAGKVAHFGVSNFNTADFDLLQSRLDAPLVTNQIEINPLNLQATEDGTLAQMQQYKVRPMAWSCLAGGQLFNGESEQAQRVRQTLAQVAQEIGASCIDQVAYAWVMKLPANPVPIIGSGKIERVKLALQALELNLNHEQWYRIWTAAKGHGVA